MKVWIQGDEVDAVDLNANFDITQNIYFGDGADGTYVLDGTQAAVAGLFSKSGSTYTLLRNAYFDTLTINSGVTLKTANFAVWYKTELINNGVVESNGGSASGQTAGTPLATGYFEQAAAGGNGGTGTTGSTSGGVGAASNPAAIGKIGKKGGTGGPPGSVTGSAPGAFTKTTKSPISNFFNLLTMWETQPGSSPARMKTSSTGSGGDGGGSTSGPYTCGNGGGAGAVGGTQGHFAKKVSGNGVFRAKGGDGGNATGGGTYACNGGGGGPSGNGGFIFIFTSDYAFVGTLDVSAGTPGTGGTKAVTGGGTWYDGTTGETGDVGDTLVVLV